MPWEGFHLPAGLTATGSDGRELHRLMTHVHHLMAYSGYVVLFDPAALPSLSVAGRDLELLEHGAATGALRFWPALDEEVAVWLSVDKPLPDAFCRARTDEGNGTLRVPSGEVWLGDPAFLPDIANAGAEYRSGPIRVAPGEYEVSASLLDWPLEMHEQHLRSAAGRMPVMVRDVLAMSIFLLAAATAVGFPVFLIGRAFDGLAEAWDGSVLGVLVLLPVWLVVLVIWRLPPRRTRPGRRRVRRDAS